MRPSPTLHDSDSFAAIPVAQCTIARAARVVGESWTLLILREALHGVTRFDQFQHDLGISRTLLTRRLASLVQDGLMTKHPVREPGRRSYNSYVLTNKGQALVPTLVALGAWGEEHLDGPKSRVRFKHAQCGGRVASRLVCECGQCDVGAHELDVTVVRRRTK